MNDVYEKCPELENELFLLRLADEKDVYDLLKVYSDKNALPYFNSDNCDGDNFYYPTKERMLEAINYWKSEYAAKGFVRFSIVDKKDKKAIGTIELFHRKANDYFNDYGIMRLDVGSNYEKCETLYNIISVIIEPAYSLFACEKIATKAALYAVERIEALKKIGFEKSDEQLIGQHNRVYNDYWVISKKPDEGFTEPLLNA